MKKLIPMVIMILLMSCSKEETPQPKAAPTNQTTNQTTLCDGTYLYEVILSTPLNTGDRVDVIYTEYDGTVTGYQQLNTGTTLTTTVTVTQPNSFNIQTMQLSVSLVGGNPNQTIQNSVILNIYHNSLLVSTSGSNAEPLCFKGTMSSTSCPATVTNTHTLLHNC